MITTSKRAQQVEYGDYQTPLSFARSVCDKIKTVYSLSPSIVLEPTFGTGNFLDGAITTFDTARSFYGVELNPTYYAATKERFSTKSNIALYNADIFSFDFSEIKDNITSNDSLLIVGNPPWATNSQLSAMGSYNLPMKENFKGCSGLDAITGKGNFDIAEYIILQLLSEFAGYECTLAMLCKTIVAKNIMRDMGKYSFNISSADMHVFNASEIFNVSCDAALFVIRLGKKVSSICNVYDFNTGENLRQFGWKGGIFYADIPSDVLNSNIDGQCQLEWRQGIKHDCSKVMELKPLGNGLFQNGLGETVQLSIGDYVFPLLKSSDIKSVEICDTRKYVIVPQRQVNADTSVIAKKDKTLWQYLLKHENLLNARRSIIYKKSPKYSVFGVGDYSFSEYKVGISGFYKEPVFAFIHSDYPVMLDDTCYFLSFSNITDAIIVTALLNSTVCISFLKSIAFLDSKRPYTKEILKRIDLLKLSDLISYKDIDKFIQTLDNGYYITKEQYDDFKNRLSDKTVIPFIPSVGLMQL